ncbi:MAG: hypothetical protein COS94_02350 [Candidatus Hydrogenedentes bacterium CG07_land_8_20_14_0_80_42_17]|nr:MAG: hypothetical protein COS94_02350 [Candidatus Hydrogenedentes bacterium CG07_land_8_20_14_0_80_42_17]
MMNMKFILSSIFVTLLIIGCGQDRDADPKYVRIAISSNPQSLDPALATDVNSGDILAKLFNGLVRFDGISVVPDLAETWTVSPDGVNYNFLIRKNVKFQNGRELTASDIAASFSRILDPKTRSKRTWVFDAVDTFFAEGNRFKMILKHPSAPFLSLLAMPTCYIVPIEEVNRLGDEFARRPCGTGPYRFVRWEDDRSVLLEKNKNYFEGAPEVEGIIYRIVPEPLTQTALLKRGSLDICEIPEMQIPVFRNDSVWKERIQTVDQLVTVYVAINTERFTDERIRRAFNMAIDVDKIISSIRNGLGTRSTGSVPPALMPEKITGFEYNPIEAKRLLKSADFDFNKKIVLLRSSVRGTLEPAEAIAGFLRDIGLKIQIEPMEFSAMRGRANKGDFDLCLLNWYADYADAENFIAPLFSSKNIGSAGNRSRFSDSETDSMIEKILSLCQGNERGSAIIAVSKRIIKKAPWIFLWYPRTAVAVSPRISGYTIPAIFNGDKGTKYKIVKREVRQRND